MNVVKQSKFPHILLIKLDSAKIVNILRNVQDVKKQFTKDRINLMSRKNNVYLLNLLPVLIDAHYVI